MVGRRRTKTLAASEGLTIGQAIHEAFDAWATATPSYCKVVSETWGE
jgi:hypothetical protein